MLVLKMRKPMLKGNSKHQIPNSKRSYMALEFGIWDFEILFNQDASELRDVLERHSGSANYRTQRVFGDVNRKVGFL